MSGRSSELHELSLIEAAESLVRREFSSLELTDHLLARIESLDPKLHSFAAWDPERSREAARRTDEALSRGRAVGPLQGIPLGLKDICATADLPTRLGSVALEPFLPGEDSAVAERLTGAGAHIIGKLTTTETAFMEHHETVRTPVNPWHADYWTGVSSSGSGVATAAGLCFGALGTDTGGSIRFPALCSGLVGLKPTWGRVSLRGIFPLAPSLDHVGPMTRRVGDAALMLEVIAGADPGDPKTLAEPVPAYSKRFDRGVSRLRVGFDESYCSEGVDDAISKALIVAKEILRDAGAKLVEIQLPDSEEALAAFPTLVSSEAALVHEGTTKQRRREYTPALRAALEAGAAATAVDYARAHRSRLEYAGSLQRVFEDVDLYLAPAWGRTTPTVRTYQESTDSELAALITFTAPQNLAGLPTLCLPGGFNENGVPFGFQIVGRPLGEEHILRAGVVYEEAAGWYKRKPELIQS